MSAFHLFRSKLLAAISGSLAAGQFATAALSPDQEKLVAANNAFAFDLANQIAQANPDKNVFISAFSVSSVLQMVNNGAAGQTRQEIQQVLHTEGLPAGTLNDAFKNLNTQLMTHPDVILNLANGMWVKEGYPLKPAFVDDNRKFFEAELAAVDFDHPQAAAAINDWASRKTQEKIKKVVAFPFPPLTRLILANAIYFKGTWVKPFKPEETHPRDFHLAGGQTKTAPMMQQTGSYSYQETPDFQSVKLPYKGGLEMELYLPSANSSPRQLLASLAGGDHWRKQIQPQFHRREGTVVLPKFKLEYEIALNESLEALGMKNAFGSQADFSGVSDERLQISEVRQNSYVDVNEEGTEAAAVTTVTMQAAAIMRPIDRFNMVLDRPFFLVISDTASGSILFQGIINDPTH